MNSEKLVAFQKCVFQRRPGLRNSTLFLKWFFLLSIISTIFVGFCLYYNEDNSHNILTDISSGFSSFKQESGNKKIRLLCWVLTNSNTHQTKSVAIKETWGKRCDKLVFMSSVEDKDLGAINTNITEGSDLRFGKHRNAWQYCYDNFLNDYDWFLKTDDDSYVIVENLRYLLSIYDPDFPLALGARFHRSGIMNYLAGGGYVISRGAVKKVAEVAFRNESLCRTSPIGIDDDMEIGRCFTNSGILLGDSRDEYGKKRFYHNPPELYITGDYMNWFPDTVKYKEEKGADALSNTTVVFHYLKNHATLYVFEFLFYKLQIYGLTHRFQGPDVLPLPPDITVIPDEVLKRFGPLQQVKETPNNTDN